MTEVKVGRPGDLLRATLGSCVGIAFLWKAKEVYGLAHCLLPEAKEQTMLVGAKFVSQAVPSLIALLKMSPDDYKDIEVFIAGGGNMMDQLSRENVSHIGQQNIDAAKKYLIKYGLKFKELDVGGVEGRQMFVDCSSGHVTVSRLHKTTED